MRPFSLWELWLWIRAGREHRRNYRLTRPQILAMQEAKFRRLVAYAYAKSPYYQALIDRHRLDPATCQPADFPELTKQAVLEHFDELVTDRRLSLRVVRSFLESSSRADELLWNKYYVIHSSGTSGTVGFSVCSRTDWIHGCSLSARSAPLHKLRCRVAYVAATRGHVGGAALMASATRGALAPLFRLRMIDISLPLTRIIDELNRFRPESLIGYPSIVKLLADAQNSGELRICPKEIGVGGEPLFDEDRTLIERTFGVRMRNMYGCTECLFLGMTVPGDRDIQLAEDEHVFEVHPDHLNVTNLFNRTLPLIRYRLDDCLELSSTEIHDSPFRRVVRVDGRREPNLVFRNRAGAAETLSSIIFVNLCVEGLVRWQVVQQGAEAFTLHAQYARGFSAEQTRAAAFQLSQTLQATLSDKNLDNVQFSIVPTDFIAADATSGKFRMVLTGPTSGDGCEANGVVPR